MKRCLLLHFWADLDTNPTLMGLLRHLIADGVAIDLICETRDFFLPPSLPPEQIRMYPVSSWRDCAVFLREKWRQKIRDKEHDFVLAVDPQGLYAARYLLEDLEIPLVYLSFEILFHDELERDEDIQLKTIEKKLSQRATFIIVQDEERGKLLAWENDLMEHRFHYLPNAPSDDTVSGKGNYLRETFNIPLSKKIVLHTGSFDFWTAGEELIAASEGFPDEYILVIHSRQIPGQNDLITRMQQVANPDKVCFSTAPLAFDDYAKLVDSCDVGLVLYKISPTIFTQKNLYNIGLSSGKFAYFARHGKPVIASDLPSYRTMFERNKNGLCTPDVASLGGLLREFASELPHMGHNNRLFFQEHLDFSKHITPVIRELHLLSR